MGWGKFIDTAGLFGAYDIAEGKGVHCEMESEGSWM